MSFPWYEGKLLLSVLLCGELNDSGWNIQLTVQIIPVSNNLTPIQLLNSKVTHLLLNVTGFWFFRPGWKALRAGLCTAHLQKQSHLLVQPVPSPFSHPPPSLYSPYCPLACFPQCYKLRTTQSSRPKAPPWMPSKLHFLESQRLASLITPGTLSDSPIYWQAEKHKTGPSQARKTPALFGTLFYATTAERLLLFSRWKSVPQK